jgi:hypothetical protein
MRVEATTRLTLQSADAQKLRSFAHAHRLDLCFGSVREVRGGFSLDAFVSPQQADHLVPLCAAAGLSHQREELAANILEISTENRFADPNAIPRGVGEKR